MRRITVLCNPTAGGGRGFKALDAVRAALSRRGIEVRVERTQSHAHAVERARAAALDGGEVVAFGGDGMVRIAAHAVRGTDATLGVLPGGRGNDFAAALAIPRDPLAACEVIVAGRAKPIDAGDCNGETFVGIASIGIESEVTRLANSAPRWGGQATYLGATLVGLARYRPATFDLTVDGAGHSYTGFIAGASNSGRFGGGMRFAPDARLDDGLLDLVVIETGPKWRFVLDTPKVFKGTHVSDPRVHVLRGREIEMSADRPFDVYADGDPIAATPARVQALPGALSVLVP
jgi:YegS/Rv2252/BmrU family lipid kinase